MYVLCCYRCSGKSKCTVELLRGKQPDPDVTKLCHLLPEGKITVKYLCYNASSGKKNIIVELKFEISYHLQIASFYWAHSSILAHNMLLTQYSTHACLCLRA